MIQFRDGFYADIRTEDRFRTVISYKTGVLEEMLTRVERRAFLRVYDGKTVVLRLGDRPRPSCRRRSTGCTPRRRRTQDILSDPIVGRFERNRDTLLCFTDCSVRDIPAE